MEGSKMDKQQERIHAILYAQNAANSPKMALMRIYDSLYEVGEDDLADRLSNIVGDLEAWQNRPAE